MPIIYGGAGVVGADDVYVVIKAPTGAAASSGATLRGATVGGAQWGLLNIPYYNSTPGDLIANHGLPILNNPAPLVQEAALFLKQLPLGGVTTIRVDDGTGLAAAGSIKDAIATPLPKINFTGKNTGTLGNGISISISVGTMPNTLKATVFTKSNPGEVFDRIPAVGSVAFLVGAINSGNINTPPSNFVVAAAGTSTVELLVNDTVALVGATDGVAGISKAALLGVDGSQATRSGVYSLRKKGMDVVWLSGCTDVTTWSTLTSFAKSETAMAVGNMPIGTTVNAALTALSTSGVSDPYFSVMLGHTVYYDSFLQQNTYVPSAPVLAGVCCSLDPSVSPGNKLVSAILGTDHTFGQTALPFSDLDEAVLQAAGINFIALGIPSAPNALGIRHGKNTSSNPATNEIAYTRKTNDLARAFSGAIFGQFVDVPQSTAANDPWREGVRNAGNAYLGPQVGKQIDSYHVQCDKGNNPDVQVKAGIGQADIIVAYLANVNKFIINLTGGQTVQVQVSALNSNAA